MKKIFLTILAAAVSCGMLATQVKADEIDLAGTVNYNSGSNLATATSVTKWFDVFGNAGFSTVTLATGVFATTVSAGDQATMATPYQFNPSVPVPGLWSVGGFTFDLTSSTVVTQNSTFLNIIGTGTVTGPGGYSASGTWSFTSTGTGGTAIRFGFTASTAVPDGGSAVALLGIALTGIEAGRRLLRSRKA